MTGPTTLLLASPIDPAAAPLETLLRHRFGEVVRVSAIAPARRVERLWVADQATFLVASPTNVAGGCDLLLRPGLDEGRPAPSIPLAVRMARKVFGDQARFWAVSADTAHKLMTEYAIDVGHLVDDPDAKNGAPDTAFAQAAAAELEFSVLQETVRVIGNPETQVPLQSVNLARLASRWHIAAREGGETEGRDLIGLALSAADASPPRNRRVLFVVPGGMGLGHMSRSLAIAGQLTQFERDFLVFNDAAYLAADAGYRTFHRQTAAQTGADSAAWREWETQALADYLERERPAAVIVDASHLDPFIVAALSRPMAEETALIWVRRELWRSDRKVQWAANDMFADLVIVPGELIGAPPPGQQTPRFPECQTTSPVIFDGTQPPLSRRRARRELGLGGGRYCLVSLGAWQPQRFRDAILAAARKHRIRIAWARSPLSPMPLGDVKDERQVSFYPMTQYLAAFDGVISAAGYNSFHELMFGYGGPVLFLPADQPGLDDQGARARIAGERNLADTVDPQDAAAGFDRFFERVASSARTPRPAPTENGASAAARLISEHIMRRARRHD